LFDGKPKEVWSIPGKLDPLQVANDSTSEWWIRRKEDADPATAGIEEGDWAYYLGNHMFRGCWGMQIQEDHRTKIKWDELRIDKTVRGTLTYNNVPIWIQGGRDTEYVISALQRRKVLISEHPLGILQYADGIRDDITGRMIYYKDQPAIISDFDLNECRIGIRYVGPSRKDKLGNTIKGFDFIDQSDIDDHEEYAAGRTRTEPFPFYEGHGSNLTYESIFVDGTFDWFRKKLYPGDEG
jgi:hypothetical protein